MHHLPRKRFGQHFLVQPTVIADIVSALAPKPTEHLIEIGPGQGALTLPVLKAVHHLQAVELDRDLVLILKKAAAGYGHLEIYEADILRTDLRNFKRDERQLRIFGNLPYNISTPLIFHLFQQSAAIADMLFMLQKEVAERLTATPNSDHYGRLSVMAQYHCQMEILFDVSPDAFSPRPQVYSSIVRLVPYQKNPHIVTNYSLFSAIVREAFGHRRKTVRNSLSGLITDDDWAHLPVRSDLRAENLSLADFVQIANVMHQKEE